MKKIFLVIIALLPFFTGCGSKLTTYEEIDYDEFIDKIENKDDFVLFIGSATCQHCDAFKETIKSVVKNYQVKIYYIDIHKFTEQQSNKFKTYINFSATPTTVFIYNGDEKTTYNRINGNLSYDKVIDKLTKAGFIKE